MGRLTVRLIVFANKLVNRATRAALWLTGRGGLHHKHLLPIMGDHHWYLEHLRDSRRCLDLGCHAGGHARAAAKEAGAVAGVDRDIAGLAAARALNGRISYFKADLERALPFSEKGFDRALALDVIEHLESRGLFLSEAHRILSDDGVLLLSAPNADTPWKRRLAAAGLDTLSDPSHVIEYTEQELRRELEGAGFEIVSMQPAVFDTPLAPLIDMLAVFSMRLYMRGVMWKRGRALADPGSSTGFRVVLGKRRE